MGIESSCDETSAAVVKNGRIPISNIISSQITTHEKYGGVVPEIASRKHIENISHVVDTALQEANITLQELDAVAVTHGPGLVGALLVGVSYAKALSYGSNVPLIGAHHLEGHIYSNFLESTLEPPFISLIVSGGHTSIILVEDYNGYKTLGSTRDDAVGEAFDKVARVIGLGYPGGPKIDNLAKFGNKNAIDFPRVMLKEDNLDFSFSGLKSSVINYINQMSMKDIEIIKEDVAASFQIAAVDVLVQKTIRACKLHNIKTVTMAGGVAANSLLRDELFLQAANNNIVCHLPKPIYCTDNAAMIASLGYYKYLSKNFADLTLNAVPSLPL